MLSEISHIEKDKYCMISFICRICKKAKLIETGWSGGYQGLEDGQNGKTLSQSKETNFQLEGEEVLGI